MSLTNLQLALRLMENDPENFKRGYSAENAVLAVQAVRNLSDQETHDLLDAVVRSTEETPSAPVPPDQRPTITLTNDDVLRVLAGRIMGVTDLNGVEYNVRLATADELEADMRKAAEKNGVSTPREGWGFHAERLTQSVDLDAVLKGLM